MLNRIRKQIRDTGKPKETTNAAPQLPQNTSPNNEQSGFICPICMTNLKSPQDLQIHFEHAHSSPDPPNVSPHPASSQENFSIKGQQTSQTISEVDDNHQNQANGTADVEKKAGRIENDVAVTTNSTSSAPSADDSASMLEEINDLKASLNEEKWYSSELKKELENVKRERDKLTEESSVLQKQISIAAASGDVLAKQKESLEKKAARMAQSMAELKALNDDYLSQKASVEEQCKNQVVELEKAATWVRDLESQLPSGVSVEQFVKEKLQRPGADDVMVLKKELVSVQTLMDQMTTESEEKGREVEREREELQRLLEEAKSQAKLVQEEFDAFKLENARLKLENEETAASKFENIKQFEEEKEKLNKLYSEKENARKEELLNLESLLAKEQSYSKSLEVEVNKLQEDKLAIEKDLNKLSNEFDNRIKLSDEEKERNKELAHKLRDATLAKEETEINSARLKEELRKVQSENIAALNDHQALHNSVCDERDRMKARLDETDNLVKETQVKNEELQDEVHQLRLSMKESESESSSLRHQLEIEVAQLRIKLEKMDEDNQMLLNQKSSTEESLEALRKSHEEERTSLQTQLIEFDKQLISLKLKASQFEEEKTQKAFELEESQGKLTSLQSSYEEAQAKSHSLSTELALKVQEIVSLKEKVQNFSKNLDEEVKRREKASEEATKLREERSHLMAQMEAGEGEAVARAQIAHENEVLRKQKEEAEEKWRNEARLRENSTSELSLKLNEVNLLLTSTQEQLRTSEQTVIRLRDEVGSEREKLVQAESEVKVKSELLASSEAAAVTQRADIENHLATVKRSLEEKTKEGEKLSQELATSRTTAENLKDQINNLRQEHHVTVAGLRNDLEKSDKEKEDISQEFEKRKKEMERLKEARLKEIEKRKEDAREMEARHAERVTTLTDEISNVKKELLQKAEDHMKEESLRARLEVELKDLKRQLEDNEDERNKTETELKEIMELLENSKTELENVLTEKTELSQKKEEEIKELNEKKEKIEKEKEILHDEITSLKDEVKSKLLILDEEREHGAELEKSLADVKSRSEESENNLKELESTLESVRLEKEETEKRLSSDVSTHVQSIRKLQDEIKAVNNELIDKNNQLQSSDLKLQELEASLSKKQSQFDEHITVLTDTEVELENLKTELLDTKKELQKSKEEGSGLESEKRKLHDEIASHVAATNELNEKLGSFETSNKELEEKLNHIYNQLEDSKQQLDIKTREWETDASNMNSEIEEQKNELETLKNELQQEIESKENMKEKNEEEIKKLILEKQEKEKEWNREKRDLDGKIDSLEAAQSLLLNHKVELQNTIETLQISVEKEKKAVMDAEEETKKVTAAKDKLIDAAKAQLEAKNRELESAEAERVVGESRLQLEIGTLSENLNSTRAEWMATTQKVESMARENDDLRGQLVVLNATIQSNNDERRALLERCLNAEQQAEKLNEKIVEMRKKLDDASAVMHELGRENQALQVKHKTAMSRQWADDRAATQCRACNRGFSLTVRRHHCRQCGEIFCNECSSRSATVASSKSPVRVCEKCYDELLTAG